VLGQGRIGETYNIGGNNEWTNIDIVKLLCERMDVLFQSRPDLASRFPDAPAARGLPSDSLIAYVTDRAGHDRRYAIDAAKISSELGYQPRYSFESGIEVTLDWYLAHEEWWRPLLVG
jgi:dTDP-glucose 4,6-dehydratase